MPSKLQSKQRYMSYEYADGDKISNQHGLHFLTFTVVGCVDLFSAQCYRDEFLKNMQHCRKEKNLLVGAYVMMTNHVHLIWQSKSGKLSDTLRDFKSYCTKRFVEMIQQDDAESRRDWLLHLFRFHARRTNQNKEFKLWTGDNHPAEIRSKEVLLNKLNHIHNTPVRAGIVAKAEDYIYSSASNYKSGAGHAAIDLLL